MRCHIGVLCRAVAQTSAGEPPNLGSLPSYAPARRLLDSLRTEYLELASQPPEPTAKGLLGILSGIERVHAALDADAAQRLATRFATPENLEKIVAVAHDMRSPLTSVLFLVDALRKGHSGPTTPHQERQLLLVYGAVFALSSLASDLLDLARGGDRLFDPVPVPFSIAQCLHIVRDIVQPIAEERKLEVVLNAPEKGDRRLGQPAALTRVLLNLTTNALKFTCEGRVTVSVTAVSRSEVEFAVCDTGRGIPPEVVDTLFDAFRRQSQSGRTVFSSAGLGLSICQKLVSAMGGTLAVQSVYGERTCFSFRLKLPLASQV
ncbi:MAG TPA: HAMP domain-containing sensor histidine kinase [Gemmatimonadaceae bacterium]